MKLKEPNQPTYDTLLEKARSMHARLVAEYGLFGQHQGDRDNLIKKASMTTQLNHRDKIYL